MPKPETRNRKPETPTRGCKGFTLLEVLLATGLSALLLIIMYVTYFSINRSIDSASENQEVLETGRILLQLIAQDLRGIPPVSRAQFVGQKGTLDNEETYRVDFVTTSSIGVNPYGFSEVGYFLIKTTEGEKVFVRRESKQVKDKVTEGGTLFELSRLVTAFDLSFYNGTEWVVQDWDSKGLGKLPKSIRISVTVTDAKGNSKKFNTEEAIPSAL